MTHRSGIIGYGHMGSAYHAKRLRELTDCVIPTAAFDIRPEMMKNVVEDGLRPCSSVEDLLAQKDIDIIVVATPNHVHKDLSIAAMRAGKNVICEKPVTMNAAELEEIIAVSKETGMQFAAHQNRRWDGNFMNVKSIVESGKIGTPFYIKHRIHGSGGVVYGWRNDPLNGGGFLMDWGIHLLDRTIWLMREHKIVEVGAKVHNILSRADDNAIVNITFDNGCKLLVETMHYAFAGEPLWTVHGDKGCIVIPDEDTPGNVTYATVTGERYADDLCYREQGPVTITSRVLTETYKTEPLVPIGQSNFPNLWQRFYENYTAALDGTEDLIVTPEQSLRLMKVIDMIYESSRTNQSIHCLL
ncbi:MAG: Gfo/Idh/MocA family oxidoreductase [Clostridia bacterium]|nr:Gfo/Idh/MocA family oxidoreductase [Clostridia bacterium]